MFKVRSSRSVSVHSKFKDSLDPVSKLGVGEGRQKNQDDTFIRFHRGLVSCTKAESWPYDDISSIQMDFQGLRRLSQGPWNQGRKQEPGSKNCPLIPSVSTMCS